METEIIINPSQEVFEEIVKWSGETEDWAFQLGDYDFWRNNFDQLWFFTLFEKESKNLIGSVSLARWDSDGEKPLYSIACYYILPEYRGGSYGRIIFDKAMQIVGNDNVTLSGVTNMVEKYSKFYGFDKIAPYFHVYTTIKLADLSIPSDLSDLYETKNWKNVDSGLLNEYDLTICSRKRQNIQNAWFNLKNTFTKVAFEKSTGKIVGYSTIRIVERNKLSVAPLYADNLKVASRLFADILNEIPNLQNFKSVSLLYPGANQDGLKLAQLFLQESKFRRLLQVPIYSRISSITKPKSFLSFRLCSSICLNFAISEIFTYSLKILNKLNYLP
ncbi:unnamed protein product [Caenorhabditis angaria]|uniref:N-acetyltransferase domain-containing protein n=1 Tax=Caenorhabditis angaria TaxID=860376 RepID=A0A9P1I8B0_9PELO|nr:unnamed protein product [Caenorhabditis angaria]